MAEWKEHELGEIIDVRDGTHDSPKEKSEGKYLITSRHIKNGKIDLSKAYKISFEDFEQVNKRSKVDKWDILFSMIGTVGEIALIDFEPDFAIKNIGLFKTGDEDLAKWIIYYLKSTEAQNEIFASLKGSTQQYITLGDLRKFPILLPPLPEQKAIASVLSSLDDKIDLLHRQNKTLEAMAETLFRQWFVEEAKDDWEEKSLLEVIQLIGGGTPKTAIDEYWDGDIPWLAGGDIASNHKSFVNHSAKSITELGLNNSSAKLLPQYATVISARGTVGKYCILAKQMAFSQSNYGILPNISEYFFFTYLIVNHVVEELQSSAYGSVFDTITTNTFKEINISLPKEIEIHQFEQAVSTYFDKIFLNTVQILTLKNLRDTLLPKLMSGEVRVEYEN